MDPEFDEPAPSDLNQLSANPRDGQRPAGNGLRFEDSWHRGQHPVLWLSYFALKLSFRAEIHLLILLHAENTCFFPPQMS